MTDIFHTCYYINLDRSRDRRKVMEKVYKNLKRIKGVDGKKMRRRSGSRRVNKLSNGELGCLQSHIRAIRRAYQDGAEEALIMEDDIFIDFKKFWVKNIRQVVNPKRYPKNAECIILHCSMVGPCRKMLGMKNDFSKWRRGQQRNSTGCYYINRQGMEKIYKRFGPNYVPRNWYPADRFIYTVLNSYNYTKPLFNMRLNRSTVTGNIRSSRRRIKNMNSMFKTYYNRVNQQRKNNKPKPKPKPESKLKQKKKIILKTRLRRRLRRLTGRLRRVKNRKRRIRIRNRLKNIRKQLS